MATVKFNDITTEHETMLDLAARLAACCTFYYAEQREAAKKASQRFDGRVAVWLVYSFARNEWRLERPGAWIEDDEDFAVFTIDGHSSEGEASRLQLIETGKVQTLEEPNSGRPHGKERW